MNLNIFSYFFFYFISIFAVVGYGFFFSQITNQEKISSNFGYSGLMGVFFLTIYSYISNFFIAHGLIHNSILIVLGIFLYLIFSFKNLHKIKENYIGILIFLILFISVLIFKTHDDFPYYHFAYSYYLTQSSSYIGIGPFNHGFRTPSSIFYLNSLFYLPHIKYYLFHMPAILIMGFTNIILLKKITKNIKKNSINFITFFSLLSLLFIDIFFYRISEHGTDRSAQILIFILIIEILLLINFSTDKKDKLVKVYILIALIISFKAFYILYLIFFLPILFLYYDKQNKLKIFEIIKNKFFIFFLVLVFLIIITNLFNSGCLLYPITFTCFDNLAWSFESDQVQHMSRWYELWSKAGAGPNFRVEGQIHYITYFNWVPNWFDEYFFNKVSDLLVGLFVLSLIVFLTFYSKLNKINPIKNKFLIIYFLLIILFLEWFYNHPALRYGGYCLFASLIFLPLSNILSKNFQVNGKHTKNKFYILVIIAYIIFLGRNVDRINKEMNVYQYSPLKETYYKFNDHHLRIQKEFNLLIDNFNNCKSQNKNCSKKLMPKIQQLYGKYMFVNDQ